MACDAGWSPNVIVLILGAPEAMLSDQRMSNLRRHMSVGIQFLSIVIEEGMVMLDMPPAAPHSQRCCILVQLAGHISVALAVVFWRIEPLGADPCEPMNLITECLRPSHQAAS